MGKFYHRQIYFFFHLYGPQINCRKISSHDDNNNNNNNQRQKDDNNSGAGSLGLYLLKCIILALGLGHVPDSDAHATQILLSS